MKKLFSALRQVITVLVLLYLVSLFFPKGEAAPDAPIEALSAMSLGEYGSMSKKKRTLLLEGAVAELNSSEDLAHFTNCMGDFAANKSKDLNARDVLKWCENEREMNRERFTSHFNELDAPNLSTDATVICRNVLKVQSAPAKLDFQWVPDQSYSMGKHRYVVKSRFEIVTQNGGKLPMFYHCALTYKGYGDTLSYENWELTEMEVTQ